MSCVVDRQLMSSVLVIVVENASDVLKYVYDLLVIGEELPCKSGRGEALVDFEIHPMMMRKD